jgi:heme-degrading monooxygenase HmoA
MKPLILIHPFKVEPPQEAEFLNAWKAVDEYMKKQTGFIETALHKALSDHPLKAFSFVNVATWENLQAFQSAISASEFGLLSKKVLSFSQGPGLYEVCEK